MSDEKLPGERSPFEVWWADFDNHKLSTELLYCHIKIHNMRGGHVLLEHSRDCYQAGFDAGLANRSVKSVDKGATP